jgi:Na+/proline symporter
MSKKIKIIDFIPGVLAILLFVARYIKFFKVIDFGDLGKVYISFVQKIQECSKPLISRLDTCSGIGTTNTIWWIAIVVLLAVQGFILYKKFAKK